MISLVGQRIGEYLIVARLGKGGMAQVYKAYHPSSSRYVAIKVLHAHLAEDGNFVQRFQREARACFKLHHAYIVRVFDFDSWNDSYYMTMQLVEGPSLKAELERRNKYKRPFTDTELVRLCAAYSHGLQYAHDRGMVHRDIKPANLMLTHTGHPVLLDFGIARIVGETQYTMTGALVGSPAYMSPEQGQSGELDGRSDLYSLGTVLYEMAAGRPPFSEDTPMATLMKHITTTPPPPAEFRPDIPSALESVILKSLEKRPEDRFQSGDEFANALMDAMDLPSDVSLLREPIRPLAKMVIARELSPADPIFRRKEKSTSRPRSTSIKCKNCNTINDNPTQFCIKCGHAIKAVCPSCYASNDISLVRCVECGIDMQKTVRKKRQWRDKAEMSRRKRDLEYKKVEEKRFRKQLEKLRDPKKHKAVLLSLKPYGSRAVNVLLEVLSDDDPTVRYGSARILGYIGNEDAAAPLINALSDSDSRVRYWAIDALRRLEAVTAVDDIGKLLEDKNRRVRTCALETLQRFDTPQARTILKEKHKWWQLF